MVSLKGLTDLEENYVLGSPDDGDELLAGVELAIHITEKRWTRAQITLNLHPMPHALLT